MKAKSFIGFRLLDNDSDIQQDISRYVNTSARVKELLRKGLAYEKQDYKIIKQPEKAKSPIVWKPMPQSKSFSVDKQSIKANILTSF